MAATQTLVLVVWIILAVATALVLASLWRLRRKQRDLLAQMRLGMVPPNADKPSADDDSSRNALVIDQSKLVIHGLMMGVSESIESFLGNVQGYGTALDTHKASIKKAMTLAALKEVERLMLREIDAMHALTEEYRRQLDEAKAGIAMQQAELDRLTTDAHIDSLTQAPNRRSFDKRLGEEFSRFKRHGAVFSVVLIDIDFFKRINDSHGHVAGDRVLRAVAGLIAEQIRESDLLARYGGEEFALILPETACAQAIAVAEKIRKRVRATRLNYNKSAVAVSLSAGVAEVLGSDDTSADLISRADAALYRAKNRGRNRVEYAEPWGRGCEAPAASGTEEVTPSQQM